MGFDVKKFQKTKFTYRTEDVPVPDLRDFFGEGEEPLWIVRGLEGAELGFVNETAQRNRNIGAILQGIIASDDQAKVQGIKDLLGLAGNTPEDIARRLEMLVLGSVDPVITIDAATKLCKVYPIEFMQLTNKITILTGYGQVPGKSKGSGETPTSEPQ